MSMSSPSLDKITNAICKNIACLNRAFQLLEKVHDEVNLREDGELEEKTICEISEYFESIIQEK